MVTDQQIVKRFLCAALEGHSNEAVAVTAWDLADLVTESRVDREALQAVLIRGAQASRDSSPR